MDKGVKIGWLQKMYYLMGQSDGMMNICIATCNQWYMDSMLINFSAWSSVDCKNEIKIGPVYFNTCSIHILMLF